MIVKLNNKKSTSSRQIQNKQLYFGINLTYSLLIFCIGLLGIYYVWSVNSLSTVAYSIAELKNENNNLMMEMELLDVKIAELDSVVDIENTDDASIMEEIENPDYLVIKEDKTYVYKD
jgi:sulfur relay (sulfurtransferase) DsrF/TusC family protein